MEKPAVLVPKPLVMLALANNLSTRNPAEAQKLYEQIKKDYPDSAVADQADRALETLKLWGRFYPATTGGAKPPLQPSAPSCTIRPCRWLPMQWTLPARAAAAGLSPRIPP